MNPHVWDLNPAKTLFGLESLTWFLDLLRLRFFVSHQRQNLVRDRVIGKKLILFGEKHSTECGPLPKVRVALKCGVVSFYGTDNFIG